MDGDVWSLEILGFLSDSELGIGLDVEDLEASRLFFFNEGGFEARDEGLEIVNREGVLLTGSELRWVTSSIKAKTSAACPDCSRGGWSV
jgi:hypothetical protein